MRTHPLDRAYRKGLKNQSAVVPAGTWEAIQAELPAVNPTKRVLPFWIAGSILLMALIVSLILWPEVTVSDSGNSTKQGDPNTQEVLALTPEVKEPLEDESEIDNEGAKESRGITESMPIINSARTGSVLKERDQNESSGNLDVTSSAVDETARLLTDDYQPEGAQELLNNQGLLTDVENSESDGSELESETELYETIDLAQIGLLSTDLEYQPEIGLIVTDCYSFGKKTTGGFLIEAYTGPTYSLKNLSSRNEDVSDYISARDSTESSQLSWHAGLRVGYEHSSGLTGRAGAHYTLVNEVFKQESRTSRTTIDSIFDSNGDLIRVDTMQVTGTRVKQTQNRYHAIDIPLLIGYRIDNGNWDIGIQAGPIFNIVFNSNGDMIDPATGNVGSFSDESDPDYHAVFKDKLGIGIYGSIYASKRIGNKLWAFVEPHLHYRLKSITLDAYPVEQKQTNIGLSIGVRLKL